MPTSIPDSKSPPTRPSALGHKAPSYLKYFDRLQGRLLEDMGRQVGNFFTAYVRVSGAFLAIVSAGFAISVIVRLFNQQPFGEALLFAVFAGIIAALLLSVRDEDS